MIDSMRVTGSANGNRTRNDEHLSTSARPKSFDSVACSSGTEGEERPRIAARGNAVVTRPVAIGNGLFAQVRQRESLMEWSRRIQKSCQHVKRDPRGQCYDCGHRTK